MVIILSGDDESTCTRRKEQLAISEKPDKKCKSQIQRIAGSHSEYAKDKENSGLYKSFCQVFERRGIASQLLMRKSEI